MTSFVYNGETAASAIQRASMELARHGTEENLLVSSSDMASRVDGCEAGGCGRPSGGYPTSFQDFSCGPIPPVFPGGRGNTSSGSDFSSSSLQNNNYLYQAQLAAGMANAGVPVSQAHHQAFMDLTAPNCCPTNNTHINSNCSRLGGVGGVGVNAAMPAPMYPWMAIVGERSSTDSMF